MNKIFFLLFFLLLIACSQNQTEKEKNFEEKIKSKNNTVLIETNAEKIEETKEIENEETEVNNSKNNQISSTEVASTEKKDSDSVEEKANSTKKTSISLKELPTFYFKTRKVTDATYYNPCKNKDGEYMFVLYLKDKDNIGTLNFHDGRQKYILPYEGISKDGDKYIFHTKPFAEFGNTPMNVRLLLVGEDLTVTFLNKETSKTIDKQTFVTEKGIQKYEANECE